MTRRLRLLLALLAISCLAGAIHRFGRPLRSPLLASIRGAETISSVLDRTRAKGLGLKPGEQTWVRELTLVALKEERSLEAWGLDGGGRRERIRSYPFTGFSGKPGPKLREGDGQIPEGIYRIEYLNPNSAYHLSLKIDYPNQFDRARGRTDRRERLGFDIFIHGSSVTVGCIPIGDDAIEDLFTLVAQVGAERCRVIIAPSEIARRVKFTTKNTPHPLAAPWEGV